MATKILSLSFFPPLLVSFHLSVMNLKLFWATLLVLASFGSYFPGVWAQLSNMAACPTGWQWNQNSLGQDPCTISSDLEAACRGIGSYSIPPLNSTQNYVPPKSANADDLDCECDTIMYSLYMSCSSCQGGVVYSWSTWIAQCTTVYVTQYPHDVPYGTAIPHWAFYDVTTLPGQIYNDTVAISVGRNPEATPKPLSTATFGTSRTSSLGSLPSTTSSGTNTGSKTNLPVIVGAAAGGVVVLSAIAIIVGICVRRRNRGRGNQTPPQPLPVQDTSEYYKVQPTSPATPNLPYSTPVSPKPFFPVPTSPNPPFNAAYYNPEDPTTFPPPIGDGQSSVTYTNTLSAHGPGGPGRYGGMPEL